MMLTIGEKKRDMFSTETAPKPVMGIHPSILKDIAIPKSRRDCPICHLAETNKTPIGKTNIFTFELP